MLAWPRVLLGSGVLKGALDKGVASFFIGSFGFDGEAAASRGPGVGAHSWLLSLKILMRELLLAVDQFHVLRWLNANVVSKSKLAQGLHVLSTRIFSIFNDVFGYHNVSCKPGLPDARSPWASGNKSNPSHWHKMRRVSGI